MKKETVLALFVTLCLALPSFGQNRAEDQLKEARENLEANEYTRARYFFVQAYHSFMKENRLREAVDCGVKASELYHMDKLYTEAFDFLLKIEQSVLRALPTDQVQAGRLRYPIIKERMLMYSDMKRAPKVFEQLKKLEETTALANNDSLSGDLLYTQAICYYTFGMIPQGDKALQTLISKYSGLDNYNQVKDCYMTLIDVGRKANSARMVAGAYDSFVNWNDSVKAKAAEKRYQALNRKYTDSLKVIEEKDSSLSARQYIIVTLGVILVILAAVLVLGGLFLARIVVISRRRKKDIDELEDRNRQKTRFIQNITAQMQPALQHLDGHLPAVQAMKSYLEHIEEMSVLENTLSEPYEMKEVNIATFCERVMETVRPLVQPDVALVVNAPKLSVAVNAEHLERLLAHLLVNAARHTPSGGKITLEFKKRSAHSHQINVSDTGDGIPEEKRAQLFVPFTEVKDLMKGDGLGLPVCALIARKMNGQLTLDTGYTKGTRFVLELHV